MLMNFEKDILGAKSVQELSIKNATFQETLIHLDMLNLGRNILKSPAIPMVEELQAIIHITATKTTILNVITTFQLLNHIIERTVAIQ